MADEDKIFVDINIFIDIIERRQNWQNSLAVVSAVDKGIFTGHVSTVTKLILYFRRSRIRGDAVARKEVHNILQSFKLVPLDESILRKAFADKRFDDVEDAVQFHSALKASNVMVTRNKRDYERVTKRMQILTPEELLAKHNI